MYNRVPSATSHNCDRMFFFSYTQTNRPPLSSRDTFSCINGWNHHLYYYQTFLPIAPLVPPSRPSTFFMFRIFFFPLINYSPLMFVSFQKKKILLPFHHLFTTHIHDADAAGSRRGSRGSSNASATSTRSNRSQHAKDNGTAAHSTATNSHQNESVTVEIAEIRS